MMGHYLQAVSRQAESSAEYVGARGAILEKLAKAKSDFTRGNGPASWANDNALEALHEKLRGYIEPYRYTGGILPGSRLRFDLVNASEAAQAFDKPFHLNPHDTKPDATANQIVADAKRAATESFGIHLRVVDYFHEWTNYRIAPVPSRVGPIGFTLTKCYENPIKSELLLRAPGTTAFEKNSTVMTPDQIVRNVQQLMAEHLNERSAPSHLGRNILFGLAASAAVATAVPLAVMGAQKLTEHMSEQAAQAFSHIPGMRPRF